MNFIQRYQPSRSWASELDRFFDRNAGAAQRTRESFYESDNAWILRLDLPGFARPDIKLTVTDRTLQLKAETPADRPFGGKVEHQWRLGDEVDETAVSAKLENGILELTIPKRPKTEPKSIDIEIR